MEVFLRFSSTTFDIVLNSDELLALAFSTETVNLGRIRSLFISVLTHKRRDCDVLCHDIYIVCFCTKKNNKHAGPDLPRSQVKLCKKKKVLRARFQDGC